MKAPSKLIAAIRAYNPPLKSLGGLIEEARRKHDDILTEPSWNPDYTVELSLRVSEIRRIAEFVEAATIALSARRNPASRKNKGKSNAL